MKAKRFADRIAEDFFSTAPMYRTRERLVVIVLETIEDFIRELKQQSTAKPDDTHPADA